MLCWLNDPRDATARQKLIDASHGFSAIPGVVTISAGPPLPPTTRPSVDSSYDLAVVITFESESALTALEQFQPDVIYVHKLVGETLETLLDSGTPIVRSRPPGWRRSKPMK